jgi:hypothetical protein
MTIEEKQKKLRLCAFAVQKLMIQLFSGTMKTLVPLMFKRKLLYPFITFVVQILAIR